MGDIHIGGPALVAITALLGALGAAVAMLFKLLQASKDDQIKAALTAKDEQLKDVRSEKDSYKNMNEELLTKLEKFANVKREAEGKPHFTPVAAVVPEHNSPTTPKQQDDADLQTQRARLTAVDLELGFPPRKAAPAKARVEGEDGPEVIDKEAAIEAIRALPEVEGAPFPLPAPPEGTDPPRPPGGAAPP